MAEQVKQDLSNSQVKQKDLKAPKLSKKEQYQKDFYLLKQLFRHFIPHKRLVFISAIFAPISITSSLFIPWLTQRIIDTYIVPKQFEGLFLWCSFLGIAIVIGYLCDAIYSFSLQKSGQLALSDFRHSLFQHSLKLKKHYFDVHPIGETLSRLTSDIEALGESLGMGVMTLAVELIKTVALIGLLFYLSWQLSLVLIIVLPLVYLVISRMRNKLRKYYDITREGLADATAYLQECLHGIKVIQLYLAEKQVIAIFKKKNHRFLHAQNLSNLYDAMIYSFVESTILITLALIIFFGTKSAASGLVTVGILVAFINTLNRLFAPVREFAQQIALIQRALSALDHIDSLLQEDIDLLAEQGDTKLTITQKESKPISKKQLVFEDLVFENVSFAYIPATPVLQNISFHIKKGENMALVGATGSGKTTILQLLTKTYTGYQGSIRINGVELSTIPKNSLMENIALMSQDVFLFEESIIFNILLDRPNLTEEEAQNAAKLIKADEFIENLEGNYQHILHNNGSNLSAGQAQLLSFTRSIVGENELILLDEATSSVDSITEQLLQNATNILFEKKTTITIAHRLSTIQNCDKILALRQGQIIEQGTHQELIAQQGYYSNLLHSFKKHEN